MTSTRSKSRLNIRALCAAMITLLMPSASPAESPSKVISWVGNIDEWNRSMDVDELRLSCRREPQVCLKSAGYHSREQGVNRITLAMVVEADRAIEYAASYGRGSRSEPRVTSIGIDDFAKTLLRWKRSLGSGVTLDRLVSRVIDATLEGNPALEFSVTLYEDDLSSTILRDELAPSVRARIDRVSLYLHYRGNGPNYPAYVRRAKALFPNARMVAGVYAYDRVDYLPCRQGRSAKCSTEEEFRLFERALREQFRLLADKKIAAIELYPGYFGKEADWPPWSQPRICDPGRRDECVALTRRMRERLLIELRGSRAQMQNETGRSGRRGS